MPLPDYTHRRPVTIPGSGGKRRWLTGHGTTQRKAEQASARRAREFLAGLTAPRTVPTLAAYSETWLTERVALRARPQSVRTAREDIARLLPALGTVPLTELDPARIQRAIGALVTQGYASSTVNRSRKVLRALLNDARRDRLVTTNPVSDTVGPRPTDTKPRLLSPDEARRFLLHREAAGDDHWPAWVLLLTYPLRVGELLGLRWCDVGAAEIAITGQTIRTETDNAARVPYTKSRAGVRTLPLTPEVRRALAWLKAQQGPTARDALLFPARDGTGLAKGMMNRWLTRALREAGLPPMGPHALRHSTISALRMGGVDVRAVMGLAGHSSTVMSDHYTHPSAADLSKAMAQAPTAGMERAG